MVLIKHFYQVVKYLQEVLKQEKAHLSTDSLLDSNRFWFKDSLKKS